MSLPKDVPPIRILIIDNDFDETSIIRIWLEKDMRVPWRMSHCVNVEEARSRINKADLVILKPEMESQSSPKKVFKDIDDMIFEKPIIVLKSKNDGQDLSTYVMEQGAADIVIRGQFSRLVDAIEFALIRQRLKVNVREAADKRLSASKSENKSETDISRDQNALAQDRHKQILRMFSGDYAVET